MYNSCYFLAREVFNAFERVPVRGGLTGMFPGIALPAGIVRSRCNVSTFTRDVVFPRGTGVPRSRRARFSADEEIIKTQPGFVAFNVTHAPESKLRGWFMQAARRFYDPKYFHSVYELVAEYNMHEETERSTGPFVC